MQIDLDGNTALVLFELLTSREEELTLALKLEAPERIALWRLEGALEMALVEPFSTDYAALLEEARIALRDQGGE